MAVKILHCADFHMDSAFDALPEEKAAARRKEQRKLLWQIADIANKKGADVVLLSGDLFDSSISYYETHEALLSALGSISAEIFISPGNHDYFCPKSPYSFLKFPKNVHIFKTPTITSFELPKLGCRVYGAGFNAPRCMPLLTGFTAEDDDTVNLMTIHGELSGDMYNPISESDIISSNLDYLALGHTHSFSGVKKLGRTSYAYPGCPEGRGFDELGEKGVIFGEVSKGEAVMEFIPLDGRQYRIFEMDLTGCEDATLAVMQKFSGDEYKNDIVRIVFKGIFSKKIDFSNLQNILSDKFFHVTFKNETYLGSDIWDSLNDDTLTGLFLKRMRVLYDGAEDISEKEKIDAAVRYGLAALENREEWRP